MNKYQWLDSYLLDKRGCVKDYKLEWGWFRYQVGGKLFAATCQPGEEHKGYDCRELLTLKCEPRFAELMRAEYPDIIPGFYMDKKRWISIFWTASCRTTWCGICATAPMSWCLAA